MLYSDGCFVCLVVAVGCGYGVLLVGFACVVVWFDSCCAGLVFYLVVGGLGVCVCVWWLGLCLVVNRIVSLPVAF